MEAFWENGECTVREIQQVSRELKKAAYTTIQTTVYRLEKKRAVRRVKRISNADVFGAIVTRQAAQRRLIDELILQLGRGSARAIATRLIECGQLTPDNIKEIANVVQGVGGSLEGCRYKLTDCACTQVPPETKPSACCTTTCKD